jgi:uncharacterized protein DUF5677
MTEENLSDKSEGYIRLLDSFDRDFPVWLRGDPVAWELVRNVIDHGCFVLEHANAIREGRVVRDSVTGALIRRALITTEGIRVLTMAGLEESASAQFRTLLDIQLNLRLVLQDDSDTMAHRLAAHHYLGSQRHLQGLPTDPDHRDALLADRPEQAQWMKTVASKMKRYFDSDSFKEIKKEVKAFKYWHRYDSVESAFKAVGMTNEYLRLYGTYSPFVHVSNIDFDFSDIDEEGRPLLRALCQRDPTRTLNLMLEVCITLIPLLKEFVQDKRQEEYHQPLRPTSEGHHLFDPHALDTLLSDVLSTFPVPGAARDEEAG